MQRIPALKPNLIPTSRSLVHRAPAAQPTAPPRARAWASNSRFSVRSNPPSALPANTLLATATRLKLDVIDFEYFGSALYRAFLWTQIEAGCGAFCVFLEVFPLVVVGCVDFYLRSERERA